MKIKINESFVLKLSQQVDYIAKYSPARARKFKNDIIKEIKNIIPNPYKHRKSIYFENENIRDLIYKGYTIIFYINTKEQAIEIFGFVKYQENPD